MSREKTLHLACGYQGAGKSTFARHWNEMQGIPNDDAISWQR